MARMPKHPLWKALEDAERGGEPEAKELYTLGGCHAYAFAQAVRLQGTAVLTVEVAVPSQSGPYAKDTVHAWCIAGSTFLDYYGNIDCEEALLARRHKESGSWPAFVKGTRAHNPKYFSPEEIQLVQAGQKPLPNKYFNEPGWLPQAMKLADRIMTSEPAPNPNHLPSA